MSSKKRKSPSTKTKIIACLNCRKGHRRCDGLSNCFQCRNRGQICIYSITEPSHFFQPLEQNLAPSIENAIKLFRASRGKEQSSVGYMIYTEEWSDELKKIFNSIESAQLLAIPNHLIFDVIIGCSAISIAYLDTDPQVACYYATYCMEYLDILIRDIHSSTAYWKKKVLLDHISLQIRLWITMREINKAVDLSFTFKMILESIDKTTNTLPAFLDVFSCALMIWVCQKPAEKLMYLNRISTGGMLDPVEPDILLFTAFCLVTCDAKSYDILGQRKLSPLNPQYCQVANALLRKIGTLISYSESDVWKIGFNSLTILLNYRSGSQIYLPMHQVSCTNSWYSFWVLGLTIAIYLEIGQPVPLNRSILHLNHFANEVWSKSLYSPGTTISVNHLISTPPETLSESSITEECDYYPFLDFIDQ